jgi:N-methylhydantoinase A
MINVGIDVGGTHTDLMAIDAEGKIVAVDKARTTKEDISKAVLGLIQNNFEKEVDQIKLVVNGTTVGTNAILERTIPEIALLTTKGFKDVLLMRRETKAELTNLQWDKPSPLVKRKNIFEIEERVDYNGSIFKDLGQESLLQAIRIIRERNIANIAVVFLHSYVNPIHEKLARDIILEKIPGADVTISYDILPEWREFERSYNTVLAAALKPVLLRYLVDLDDRLKDVGFKGTIEIMQANAGIASVENIRANPISTLFSGVAGGVIGGLMNSDPKRDKGNIITFDMGGTSTDICLVNNGAYTVTTEQELEWEGYLKFPCIDIHSIGAGGGSIAWIDEANCLHVGPQSAGALPGPACYDTGGERPTVTDANLLLGYLNPNNYLGGRYKLSTESARKAIEKLSRKLNLAAMECAYGIKAIVDANMVNGIRHVSVEKGHDPREYALVAFGGAGPIHAAELMEQLGIKRAIIPLYPGNVSATGLLGARPRIDLMRTMYAKLDDADLGKIESQYRLLEEEIVRRTKVWDVRQSDLEIVRSMDMRYTGQTHELIIDRIPADLSNTSKKDIASLFHSRHNDLYSYYNEYEPIAIVNLRVAVLGPKRAVSLWASQTNGVSGRPPERRVAVFKGVGGIAEIETKVFPRKTLAPGFACDGPAIIEEDLSTTLVPPGFKMQVLEQGVLEIREKR